MRRHPPARSFRPPPLARGLAAAVLVGLLTFGAPAPRRLPLASPPAVVRVVPASAAALRWRELVRDRPLPN